ncbi:uncharacterized protein [Panulirus ornatus]|uniref:uncharacterized protein n=1 Tax=Panulirus ornatus TaxID=150431 RepID=UPI003A870EA1
MLKVAVVCVAVGTLCALTLANPSQPVASEAEIDSKTLQNRDYKAPEPAEPPAEHYHPDEGDQGYYYYYYPVEEDKKKLLKDDKCAVEKLLIPLIIICVILGILTANSIGLLPSIELPPLVLPTAPILSIQKNRALNSMDSYIPWDTIDQLTLVVTEALESEQCLPRLVCESGRYADGRTTAVSFLEFFAPRKLQSHMKIFKDSALKKTDCSIYKCSYIEEYKRT